MSGRIHLRGLDVALLAATLEGPWPLPATAQPQVATLKPIKPPWERYIDSDAIPTAGDGRLLGLFVGGPDTRVDIGQMIVTLPKANWPRLCVDVATRDGRYRAGAAYDIDGARPGRYRLDFRTEHAAAQRLRSARDVAASARLARSCESGTTEGFVPVSWREDADRRELHVLLNLPAVDTIEVTVNQKQAQPCSFLKDPPLVSYNAECTVALRTEESEVAIRVQGWVFEKRQEPLELRVWLP